MVKNRLERAFNIIVEKYNENDLLAQDVFKCACAHISNTNKWFDSLQEKEVYKKSGYSFDEMNFIEDAFEHPLGSSSIQLLSKSRNATMRKRVEKTIERLCEIDNEDPLPYIKEFNKRIKK